MDLTLLSLQLQVHPKAESTRSAHESLVVRAAFLSCLSLGIEGEMIILVHAEGVAYVASLLRAEDNIEPPILVRSEILPVLSRERFILGHGLGGYVLERGIANGAKAVVRS